MFCCSPRQLVFKACRLEPDFQNKELYSAPVPTYLDKQSKSSFLTKHNHIDIDENYNFEFKIGHSNHSKFSFQLCDASRQIYMNESVSHSQIGQVWKVLMQGEQRALEIGDRIKVGMTEFGVYSKIMTETTQTVQKVEVKSEETCRYCFVNTYNFYDPLVSICKCSGSVKYLHLSCLRSWVNSKVEKIYRDNVVFYIYRKLECELCRGPWPLKFTFNNNKYDLFSFQYDSQDEEEQEERNSKYVILETDSLDNQQIEIKIFGRINVNSSFLIGEDEDSVDLSLDTFGTSPIHCRLEQKDGNIYISDCGSITGTLVTLHQEETFTSKKQMLMQFDQILICLKAEDQFFECFSPELQYRLRFKRRAYLREY